MTWPPEPGELLPRAEEPVGVREKLAGYSLNETHEEGGPKARGFRRILGIMIADLEHLEGAILAGIGTTPIGAVRDNLPYGINCVVDVTVRGIGGRGERIASVRTAWELTDADARPRLVSAYLKP